MSIRRSALRVLESWATNHIDFSFTATTGIRVEVSRASFRRVASAIRAGRIRLVEDQAASSGDASYSATGSGGTFHLPRLMSRVQEGYFVHESVHASFDLTLTNTLPVADEESACYIAEALYYRRTGLDRRRYRDSAWIEAIQFADDHLRGVVNTTALNALRHAVATDPTYSEYGKTGCYHSDG